MVNLLGFIPIIGKVLEKVFGVVDKLIPDKDLAAKLKAEIQTTLMVQEHNEIMALIEGRVKIILAETTGGWLQRNWRPMLMLICMAIIFNNYVLFPYASFWTDKVTMLDLPDGLWALLNVGTVGYVAGRTVEKVMKKES